MNWTKTLLSYASIAPDFVRWRVHIPRLQTLSNLRHVVIVCAAGREICCDGFWATNTCDWILVCAAHQRSLGSRARSSRERRCISAVAQRLCRACPVISRREGDSGSPQHTNTSALTVLAWYRHPESGTSSCYGFAPKLDPLLKSNPVLSVRLETRDRSNREEQIRSLFL